MGVISFIKGGFLSGATLKRASEEAQKKQREGFKDPETRKAWGIEGETPEKQRSLDEERGPVKPGSERPLQSDPESKG